VLSYHCHQSPNIYPIWAIVLVKIARNFKKAQKDKNLPENAIEISNTHNKLQKSAKNCSRNS
jgi:hypothetical protein